MVGQVRGRVWLGYDRGRVGKMGEGQGRGS